MIVKIKQNANGSHANQSIVPKNIPDGWALVPPEIKIPSTFPFVDIKVVEGIVTEMTAGTLPLPEPTPEPEPTAEERLTALEEAVLAMMEV